MVLISLKMQAFESYNDETFIDFEELNKQGIYLISGKTGSGKSAIFDAICFALYGEASTSKRETDQIRTKDAKDNKPLTLS